MYFVYIIECKDKSLYTGITTDVERRFKEHQAGIGGRYTSAKKVVKIVYKEKYPNRSSALKREAEIKGWPREKKLNLINNNNSKISKKGDKDNYRNNKKRKEGIAKQRHSFFLVAIQVP